MAWADTFPGAVLGFREGLEAFLMIGIILDYLKRNGDHGLRRPVQWGLVAGIGASILFGLVLWAISAALGSMGDAAEELWGALASVIGLVLLSTFVYWMMKHGRTVYKDVTAEVKSHFSAGGLFGIALIMVLREGAEIGLFAFSSVDRQNYVVGILFGVLVAAGLAILITRALVKVNLKILFSITLGYVVLQCAWLLGHGAEELISGLAAVGAIPADGPLFTPAWELRGTLLDHKTGWIGVPLNVLLGWSADPIWLQLGLQVAYIAGMFLLWRRVAPRPVQQPSMI